MRGLLRSEAADGRAVLVSSHLLAEVAQSVDDVVVIAGGTLRGHGPLEQVLGSGGGTATRVRSSDDKRLTGALMLAGHDVERDGTGALLVPGATPEAVGAAAAAEGLAVTELAAVSRSLEDAFFELTGGGR